MYMKSEIIVGIDLGTTNSEIAVIKNGKTHLISIDGSKIVPSVVSIAPDGQVLVGIPAVNHELAAPLDTIRCIKRKMGQDETLTLRNQQFSPQTISSLILKRLKLAAEEFLNEPVSKAVITVPAFFTEKQREATNEAAVLAGLEPIRLLNEPTAAALAYSLETKQSGYCLVYDLGGGTFDVSVVSLSDQLMEVKASHGDTELGGTDFDRMIADQARASFQKEHGVDLAADPLAWARVMRAAEAVKIRLSEEASAQLSEEFIASKEGVALHLQFSLSRTEFEQMIRPSIERTLSSVRMALQMACLSAQDLHRVILVGGATYTPLVSQILEEELFIAPQAWIDPSAVVAMGAAIEAANLAGQSVGPRMIDITPHSLGIECMDSNYQSYHHILIRRNTPLPCSNSRVFYKYFQNQDAIEVRVFQGESTEVSKNRFLGNFRLEGLENSSSSDVHIKFYLDRSGLLQVTATDISSGKQACHLLKKTSKSRTKQMKLSELDSVRIYVEKRKESDLEAEVLEDFIKIEKPEGNSQELIDNAQALLETNSLEPIDQQELSDVLESAKTGDQTALQKLSELMYFLI
jgi:Molecular chaperone